MAKGGRVLVVAALGLLQAAVAPALLVPPSPVLAWRTETIDGGDAFEVPGLALDGGDRPTVLYQGPTTFTLASRTTTGWSRVTGPANTWSASLALTSFGEPRIAYASLDGDDVRYARRLGMTWVTETVDGDAGHVTATAIALGAGGEPFVAYSVNGGNADPLRFAHRTTGGWQTTTLDADASSWFSLAVDAAGRVHLAYCDLTTNPAAGSLLYGVRATSGAWTWTTVDAAGGPYVSLALDDAGRPHLAYAGAGDVLRYARLAGAWSITTVDLAGPTGYFTSLALGPDDLPRISYWQVFNRGNPDDPTRGHLRFASLLGEGAAWVTETVDTQGRTGEGGTKLVVDSQGLPHVAYVVVQDQVVPPPLARSFDVRFAEPPAATALWVAAPAGPLIP